MNYTKGKLYKSGGSSLVILCTGKGTHPKTFAGVVVESPGYPASDFQVGDYSQTWTAMPDVFRLFPQAVTIDNKNYSPPHDNAVGNG